VTVLDGEEDKDMSRKDVIPLTMAYCSLHVMPLGGCSLRGEARGDVEGEDEFEIVLAEGLGEVDGLNSMPESLGCSVCGVDEEEESIFNELGDSLSRCVWSCCCCCCCCFCCCN